MNELIWRAAGVTKPSFISWETDTEADDGLGEHITPDADQGHRDIAAPPPISAEINTRIRRAAGINVRPGQRSVPEIGGY